MIIHRDNKGLTLMEAIVSMAVFSTVVTIASSIFIVSNNNQIRTRTGTEMQRVAQDIMETVSRDIRSHTIDYAYYLQVPNALENAVNVLVLRDTSGDQLRYRIHDNAIQTCTCTATDCSGACSPWDAITPDDIYVSRLDFYISPASNPFLQPTKPEHCYQSHFDASAGLCDASAGCWPDMTALAGHCYNPDMQPQVTAVLEMNNNQTDAAKNVDISLQTTVTSRVYGR